MVVRLSWHFVLLSQQVWPLYIVKLLLRSMNSVTMIMVAHLHIREIPDEKLICNK